MGKKIKGSKKQLAELLNAVDKVPAAKAASDIDKHISFRKALKKELKAYLDARATVSSSFDDVRKKAAIKAQGLNEKIAKADEEAKKPLQAELDTLQVEVNKKMAKAEQELTALLEGITAEQSEVTFDNEAFLFAKGVIKDNIADIFKNQHGSLDNDGLENVLDLFDNAE